MAIKQKCNTCYKNYVVVKRQQSYVECYECQKKAMSDPIDDPEMKKMFDIPEEFYKENSFLRSIKINYLRYGNLSERQIEVFKTVVKDIEEKSKKNNKE